MKKNKNTVLFIILLLSFATCNTPSVSFSEAEKPKITFITNTDLVIDSIAFAKLSGTRAEDIWDYRDTIKIYDVVDIDDKYNILYFLKNEIRQEQLWLQGNDIIIEASIGAKVKIDTIMNSPFSYYTNDVYDKYYNDLIKNNYEDSIVNQFLLTEIKKNLDHSFSNDLSKMFLYENQERKENLETLYEIIKDQNQIVKQHRSSPHTRIKKILNANTVTLENYTFFDVLGNLKRIDASKDKKYILDFWFTDCPPCIKDHQIMKTKIDYLKKDNYEVIGISTDYDLETWTKFIEQKNYPWMNYKENGAVEKVLSKDLGIQSYPTYIVLDKEGQILARKKMFKDLMAYIKK